MLLINYLHQPCRHELTQLIFRNQLSRDIMTAVLPAEQKLNLDWLISELVKNSRLTTEYEQKNCYHNSYTYT